MELMKIFFQLLFLLSIQLVPPMLQAEITVFKPSTKLEEQFLTLYQNIDLLTSTAAVFEKKYPEIPKFLCPSCKNTLDCGAILGSIIGLSVKDPTSENLEKLTKLSAQMTEIFSKKTPTDLGLFMLKAAKELTLKCPRCQSTCWELTQVTQSNQTMPENTVSSKITI